MKQLTIFFSLIISLNIFASEPLLNATKFIKCNGYDMYADTVWEDEITLGSQGNFVKYTETYGTRSYTESISEQVIDGKIEIRNPDGAVKTFLNLTTDNLEIEYYDRASNERLRSSPFDQFDCAY